MRYCYRYRYSAHVSGLPSRHTQATNAAWEDSHHSVSCRVHQTTTQSCLTGKLMDSLIMHPARIDPRARVQPKADLPSRLRAVSHPVTVCPWFFLRGQVSELRADLFSSAVKDWPGVSTRCPGMGLLRLRAAGFSPLASKVMCTACIPQHAASELLTSCMCSSKLDRRRTAVHSGTHTLHLVTLSDLWPGS